MVDLAHENRRFAGATGTLTAAGEYEHPGLLHHLEDAAIRRHGERLAAECELHLEVSYEHRCRERCGLEALDVQRMAAAEVSTASMKHVGPQA